MRSWTFSLLAVAFSPSIVLAWAPHHDPCSSRVPTTRQTFQSRNVDRHDRLQLKMSEAGSGSTAATTTSEGPGASSTTDLTTAEWDFIQELFRKGSTGSASLKEVLLDALPTMSPRLIVKVRQGQYDSRLELQRVSITLNSVLDERLEEARELLQELLKAGEIRKLDATIGKAARGGKLDVAFFQVLNMNLVDAVKDEAASKAPNSEEKVQEVAVTTRYQILQHIYTRCQEEVEKTVPPGVALLNRLLRTDNGPIRDNQLKHYLLPQPNVITTPDGKELELKGVQKILVPHMDFIEAIGNAVRQIRTVERSGGASKVVTAGMVENCRQVAMEARVVIGQHFGRESDELKQYEEGLQPVFRPDSAESVYIRGE
jgi:hypothetical protein